MPRYPVTTLSLTKPAVARLQEFFRALIRGIEDTSRLAPERRLFWALLFMCLTLSCPAACIHPLGIAHQCVPQVSRWFQSRCSSGDRGRRPYPTLQLSAKSAFLDRMDRPVMSL